MSKQVKLYRPYEFVRFAVCRLRGLRLSLWIRAAGGTAGSRIVAERGVHLRHWPGPNWHIGSGVYLGRGVIFDVPQSGALVLGDNVKIMHHTLIASSETIRIEDDVQIAEYVSIRDQNHDMQGEDMLRSPVLTNPVHIARGSWVGRGAAILAGVSIGEGAVVAANAAVAAGHVPARAVVGGVPARVIGSRALTKN